VQGNSGLFVGLIPEEEIIRFIRGLHRAALNEVSPTASKSAFVEV